VHYKKLRRNLILGTNTCVTPVYLEGSVPEAMIMVNDLRENYGIFLVDSNLSCNSKGIILLRMIPTTSHTLSDVDETLTALKQFVKN
jgi:glycine C-acetyltransferase